jgi:hypothetical protein
MSLSNYHYRNTLHTNYHFNNPARFIFGNMKNSKQAILFFIFFTVTISSFSQDTLPKFTARDLGKGRAQISWTNAFQNTLVQLTVQRSFDSLKYFRSIFSSQSPELPQNGFVDNNLPQGYKVFYRIQYVFEGGAYFFTKSRSISAPPIDNQKDDYTDKDDSISAPTIPEVHYVKIYKQTMDSFLMQIPSKDYKRFKDSIAKRTKDTLYYIDDDQVVLRKYVPKPVWKSSLFVFTNIYGYVNINLPLAKQHKYSIRFFEENGTEIFKINHIKEPELVLDKVNFIHAGWFLFELYEDDKLKEKNKFYIERD